MVSGCYNEEDNVRECYEQVKKVFAEIGRYRYEHIFIDNASKDGTAPSCASIAATDKNVKVILNARNFGHIRSPLPRDAPGARRRRHQPRLRPAGPARADQGIPQEMGGRLSRRRRR